MDWIIINLHGFYVSSECTLWYLQLNLDTRISQLLLLKKKIDLIADNTCLSGTTNYDIVWVGSDCLTHWGRVMHRPCDIYAKLTIIGSGNGLSPGRRQAIIWTDSSILLFGTNSEDLIEIQKFSLNKMHLKMSSAKWPPFRLGLNVLIGYCIPEQIPYHRIHL